MNSIKILRNHEPLGRLQIDTTKLLNKNVLKLNYLSGSMFPKKVIPINITVSDDLQAIILDMVNSEGTNEIDQNLQAKLSIYEQEILKNIVEYAGITRQIKYKPLKVSTDILKDRLRIIQGSIEAGNDSDEMLKEFMQIIKILHASNNVSDNDYKDLKEAFESLKIK